jgi:drug/metabolite transporter (DMT)-like permease
MEETPIPRKLPPFRSFVPFAILLAVIGWGGIYYLISSTLPTLGPRWLFFFFLTLAMTGSGLPIIVFLNIRFPSYPPIDTPVVIRQACWVGVFSGVIAWLQLGRILTPTIGVIIAVGLVVIEGLIRFREKSRWAPAQPEPSTEETNTEGIFPPEDNPE